MVHSAKENVTIVIQFREHKSILLKLLICAYKTNVYEKEMSSLVLIPRNNDNFNNI